MRSRTFAWLVPALRLLLFLPPVSADVRHEDMSAVDEVVDRVNAYFAAQPRDLHAATYIEGQDVVVGVTHDLDLHRVALASVLGDLAGRLDVVKMEHPLDALYELQDSITAAIASFEAQGVVITVVGVYEDLNVVGVGVASDRTAATQVLRAYYGVDVPVIVEDAGFAGTTGVSGRNAPPFRGGQELVRPHETKATLLATCTSGFVGYDAVRLDAGVFWFGYELITAGHCEYAKNKQPASGTTQWLQGADLSGVPVGFSDLNTWAQGSTADALSIPIPAASKSGEVAVAPGDYRPVRCIDTKAQTQVGQPEYLSGYASGARLVSGSLRRKWVTVRIKDDYGKLWTLKSQNETTIRAVKGDSGGSVIGTRECHYRAQGIMSAGNTVAGAIRSYYTPVDQALRALGLDGVELAP